METIKTYFKNYWWKLIAIALVIFVDLLTKSLIVRVDELGNVVSSQTVLIPGVLVIYPTLNSGAGFSMLSGKTIFLIVITILFLIALICFDIFFKKKSIIFGISTALIFGGAVGNLVDRIMFQKVRDFIYLQFINFPVFNVADISLTFGVILLAIYVIFIAEKSKKTNDTQSQNNCAKLEKATTNQNSDNSVELVKNTEQNKIGTDIVNDNNVNTFNNSVEYVQEDAVNSENKEYFVDTKSQHKGDNDEKDNS